ncbi:MAG: uridine kinase, partial [Saprospiraceae bacterium]|nr:uridine kinase [Saprospiraceae bacterium]
FDLKLYIHAKENLKLIRRIKRDKTERNYPVEDVIYRYEHHVMPSYEKFILNYKEDVDIIINNNKSFDIALDLVHTYVEKRLSE